MKRALPYPDICDECRYPTRLADSVFVNGRGWLNLCPYCDFRVAGIQQLDPARIPLVCEVTVPGAGQ